jgi:glycosyltransferase involved in cell wall biosynthesis
MVKEAPDEAAGGVQMRIRELPRSVSTRAIDPRVTERETRLQPPILLSANSLWNIVNFRSDLVRRLASFGPHVHIAAPHVVSEKANFSLPAHLLPLSVDRSGLHPAKDAALLLAYHRLMRRIRPSAYLGWTVKPNIYGALAAQISGVPAILNVSGLGTAFLGGAILSRFVGFLYRVAFRRAHAVFFQNRDDRDLFLKRKLVRPEQARLVPGSGIDLYKFPLTPLHWAEESPRFLLVARLLGDKGVREYAAAARQLRKTYPHASFQLLGPLDPANRTGIAQSELSGWVEEGLIEYLGQAEDVRPFIAAATAIVLPSYREGLPRTLLEGGAMGRVLVATDVPGCRDLVDDGVNGFLCVAKDTGSLASALTRVIRLSEAELISMGRVSREKVERDFSQDRVAEAYLQALGELGLVERQPLDHLHND